MADRGRGAARGGRGTPSTGARGGGRHGPTPSIGSGDKPKREAILDLSKYVNEKIRVKFTGGREVTGLLKGYDQLLNLVLDEVEELVEEPEPRTRSLGLAVLRGPTIVLLSPVDGSEEIANPFLAQE
ncbi:small nuclear ribonucleoprotein [Moniliophthora roreri MCA 2997]|uniref:Small nuclear ribonucleoprotein n=2 Tax=Moniliophthora roreri TaxID=221103 RepID=V2X456_MONRO|nr:small nuclear ribonucleoprotein [Moniliophthora roreri MCA 2997]KAI3608684.1 small nuclear ribonucleoprotein [Moniliophthora roreri]